MGESATERVVTGLVHVGHDPRQLVGIQVDAGELLPGQVALDRDRRKARGGVDVADDGPAPVQGIRQQPTQQVERLVQVLGLVAHHQHPETWAVAGDDHAVAVEDATARRGHQSEVEPVVRRHGGVLAGLDDLKLGQSAGQGQSAQGGQAAQHEGAAQEGALALIDVREEDRGFRAHRNLTSPSSNRSIIQLANGKRSRVGTTWPIRERMLGGLRAIRDTAT